MKKFLVFALVMLMLFTGQSYGDSKTEIYGEVKDGVYRNKTLGAEAYFSENWQIFSREQIAALMGNAAESSETLRNMEGVQTPTFYAASTDGLANINIVVNNIGVIGHMMTPEYEKTAADEIFKNAADNIKKIYSEMGVEESDLKQTEVNFTGRKHHGFYYSSKTKGVSMYQKQVVCFRGEYMYMITATSVVADITDNLLGMFKPLN